MHNTETKQRTFNDGAVLTGNGLVTHHACRAQMGSISVMHTMAPRALRAVQQPFPTYRPQDSAVDIHIIMQCVKTNCCNSENSVMPCKMRCEILNQRTIHLSITTHDDLFASKHYICGPLQAGRHKQNNTL